jgi:SAM-dependent methyltransferase
VTEVGWEKLIESGGAAGARFDRWLADRPAVRSFVRSSVQTVNAPLAKARFRKEVASTSAPIKLEIGGHHPREGWLVTNVNAVTRLYLDATRRWPLKTSSIDYVFSDNVIEHLTLQAGRQMLLEAHRCLRPGGIIRTVTPDLRAHVDMYLQGGGVLNNEVANHYRDIGLDVEYPIDLVRIPVAAFGHHAGYVHDFDTLAAELHRAGFSNVIRCELGESAHQALRGLDLRNYEGGAQLAVEATA